ncbi:hypothetical protein ACCO45_013380 [Purpureocillium lilacinum]|uniref:Uncharacterized protein n=1 Tax=Purpureocillium lilacinum TaxID=33203 RepID=A0ACC4D6W6_PURLI
MQGLIAAALLCGGLVAGRPAAQAVGPCTKLSSSTTKWDVVNLGFSASYDSSTTPKSANGSVGSISFELANAAVAYRANCSAQSTEAPDFFDGQQEYRWRLNIKQTWSDGPASKADTPTARQTTKTKVLCGGNSLSVPMESLGGWRYSPGAQRTAVGDSDDAAMVNI